MELYKGFLNDKKQYLLAQEYWDKLFVKVFAIYNQDKDWAPWFKLEYLNGKPIMDGNPIATRFNKKSKKAIRIIQTDKAHLSIFAHMDFFDKDVVAIPELVVHCFLTDETSKKAESLIDSWVSGNYTFDEMKHRIEVITNQSKLLS